MSIKGRQNYRFALEPNIKEFTKQLTASMYVRLTGLTLVSRSSAPGNDMVERADDD